MPLSRANPLLAPPKRWTLAADQAARVHRFFRALTATYCEVEKHLPQALGRQRPSRSLKPEDRMPHLDYPAFDIHPVSDIIRIVRTGAIQDESALLAKCAWEIAGAGLGATLGEPDPHDGPFKSSSLEGVSVDKLEECHDALEQADAFAAAGDASIPPALKSALIQLAMEAINYFLTKKSEA